MTRDEKLAVFGELTKLPGIKRASVYADRHNQVRILIDHPHSYRTWTVVGPDSVPGFWHLESSLQLGLDVYQERMDYTYYELILHESQFERLS